MFQVLLICGLLGLGSATTQHSTCYVSESADSDNYLRDIRDSLASISTSLQQLVAQGRDCSEPPSNPKLPPIGTLEHPASSCRDIPPQQPSGMYWIKTASNGSPLQLYCDMNRKSCSCNTTGGWTKVADLDMTNSSQTCPTGFRLVTRPRAPIRTCGRVSGKDCVSTVYPSYGIEYSHVCGRVIAYQDKTPDAFSVYATNRRRTIDDTYVNGVSLTHGQSPRKHIWTFAAAADEVHSNNIVCPCTKSHATYTGVIPPFIGNDYFCDTGARAQYQFIFYPDDPLWDGKGCGGTSTCCSFNNPPWFCKQLHQPTTEDIELRLCADQSISDEDTPLELVEIYIH